MKLVTSLKPGWLLGYNSRHFTRDLQAGLTVAAVAVPQAMAYALIAGVPPEYGLYTAIVMTAIASLLGSSEHLINGPTNAISLVVFSAVAGLGIDSADGSGWMDAVFLLCLLVGCFQVLIAVLKLGDLTRYVSESVVIGFMTGAGVLVALGQVPALLGLQAQGDGHLHFLHRLWMTLRDGGTPSPHAVLLGCGTIATVVGLRLLGRKLGIVLPDLLTALILASGIVWLFGWDGHRVEVIGQVPASLPRFHVPNVLAHADWVRQLAGGALAISLLGLLEALAIAKSIAARTRERLDYNRQCLAEGLANLGGGLFQCIPGSGSLTRSAVNFQAGAATRLSGVLSAVAVAGTLLLFAPLAHYVPRAALAGLLMVIAWRLIDWQRLRYALHATRFDAGVLLATFASVLCISIEFSILIGTFLSFLFFVPRAARLNITELVLGADRVVREREAGDPVCTRVLLYSIEGELFFGAAPDLEELFRELRRRAEQGYRIVVLRLKRARNPDMVCLERLHQFLEDMQVRKVTVLLCGLRPDFARALHNLRFHHGHPPEQMFVEEATSGSSTLRAVRRAYEILGDDLCPHCPRRNREQPAGDWYYMI